MSVNFRRKNNKNAGSVLNSGLILGLHLANERRRFKVTPNFMGWVQT